MYEEDLQNATEIVLNARRRVRRSTPKSRRAPGSGGRAARAAAGALRIGNTVGAAIGNRRMLGPAESGLMFNVAVGFLLFSAVALLFPLAVTMPLALLAVWIAATLLVRAWRIRRGSVENDPGSSGH
jgi:cardiolipin synthase